MEVGNILKGNWKEMKGKVQAQWAKLSDEDLQQVEGRYDELVGKIQQRYGKSKEEAQREVEEFKKRLH